MEEVIAQILTQIGLGVASNTVYDVLKNFIGKKVKQQEIARRLESIEELTGRVEEVMGIFTRNGILNLQEQGLVEVAGTHEASGIGNITGLDIQGPAKIKPGTVSKASGIGNITGTIIGGKQ